jgi:hypothetical protein
MLMFRVTIAAAFLTISSPASACGDELAPISPEALIGKAYEGASAASEIRFINVRARPVRLMWITFEGARRFYATIATGAELVQPTYVAHRWLVEDAANGQPLQAFISTRSAARDEGTAQIAIIR